MSRVEYYDLYVMNQASDPEIRYVYFEAGITPVIDAVSVIDKLHEAGESDVTKLNVKLIKMCVYEDISVWYAKRAVSYYEENAASEHGEEAFEEYIEKILNNIPYEEAFWGLTYLEGWDNYSDIDISDLMSDSEVFDD